MTLLQMQLQLACCYNLTRSDNTTCRLRKVQLMHVHAYQRMELMQSGLHLPQCGQQTGQVLQPLVPPLRLHHADCHLVHCRYCQAVA